MKKISLTLFMIICMAVSMPTVTYANMAAPDDADIGSTVNFEKSEEISVISEVLDINVTGSKAEITARYTMKNTTNDTVTTPSMFISPNIETGKTKILVNENEIDFISESYNLNYDTQVSTEDWQYIILTDDKIPSYNGEKSVDTVTFNMEFAPNEQYDVVVSYIYALGGYPNYDFDVKYGEINYYLTPASMWKDFENLTINLYLDKDMPIIENSNLEFDKIATRHYQYVSDTLPTENLNINIDENWFQSIFSTLRSPYLWMLLLMFSPIILVVLLIIIVIIFIRKKHKKR